MVLGEGRWEKAACLGLRARGRKTRGRLAAAQLIQSLEGCVKKFEPYLIILVWGAIKCESISSFACLFLTDLKRGKKSLLIPSHYQISCFYLFPISFQALPNCLHAFYKMRSAFFLNIL